MRVTRWIWAAPAAFLVHDAEELLTVERWLRTHATELPAALRPLLDVTTRQFAVAVAVLAAGFLLAAAHGARQARRDALSLPFLLAAGALVGNALTHVGQAALLGGYTPGVATAVLVVLPYGLGLGRTLRAHRLASARRYAAAVGAGVLLQIPLALMALAIGRAR